VTDQPVSPPFLPSIDDLGVADARDRTREADEPEQPRRQPGDPHPYMLQRNPPNLWILVALTIFSLVLTVVILALTVVL
jgi:hypothetical protein